MSTERSGILSWGRWRRRLRGRQLGRKGLAELVGISIKTTSGAVGLGVLGESAAAFSKVFVESLLPNADSVDGKLDRLLAAPYRAGIKFLGDAAAIEGLDPKHVAARLDLLVRAHDSFTHALSVLPPESTDLPFVLAIDCLALAVAPGYEQAAQSQAMVVSAELKRLEKIAEGLRDEALRYETFGRWVRNMDTRAVHGIEALRAFAEVDEIRMAQCQKKLKSLELTLNACREVLQHAHAIIEHGWPLSPDSVKALPAKPSSS